MDHKPQTQSTKSTPGSLALGISIICRWTVTKKNGVTQWACSCPVLLNNPWNGILHTDRYQSNNVCPLHNLNVFQQLLNFMMQRFIQKRWT